MIVKGVFFSSLFIFLAIFFMQTSSGVITSSCGLNNNDALIMLLSGETNAQGQTYNGPLNYPVQICYNQLFTGAVPANSPHECSPQNNPTNTVLKLHGATNSHAESATSGGNYGINVCYKGLSCNVRQNSCLQGEAAVIYLSAETNAHLSKTGGQGTGYPYAICCTSQNGIPSGNINSVQWQNGAGQIITKTNVNKTVRMIAFSNLPQNTPVRFQVWEKDITNDDLIRTFTTVINNDDVARVDFLIDDEDIRKGDDPGGLEGQFLEFYFNASNSSLGIHKISEIIKVNKTQGENTNPVAQITKVKHRGIYFTNVNVEINQSSYDLDGGALSYKWIIKEDNLIKTEQSFNYIPSTTGQKTITLRVTDSKGAWNEQQIAITAVNSGGGLLAFINSPFHRQIIKDTSSGNDPLGFIYYANDSYVIKISGSGCPGIECIAGNCPLTAENKPSSCQSNIQIANTPQNFENLFFKWTFDDGYVEEGLNNFSGMKNYGSPGNKLISLLVNYTNTQQNLFLNKISEREFTLVDLRQCVDEGRTWVEFDSNGVEIRRLNTMAPGGICGGVDGIVGTPGSNEYRDNCCPSGYVCNVNGCSLQSQVQICSDYGNEEKCEQDPFDVADRENGNCGKIVQGQLINCWCDWDNVCKFKMSSTPGGSSGSTTGGGTGCTYSTCTLETLSSGQCNNGYKIITVGANFVGGSCSSAITQNQCQSEGGERRISCGAGEIELGFFGMWQFLLSALSIFIIYFLIFKKRA